MENVVRYEKHAGEIHHNWILLVVFAEWPELRDACSECNTDIQAVHDDKVSFGALAQFSALQAG